VPKDLEKRVDPTPGLAGGPQPAPPGISDGTPRPARAQPETPAPAPKGDPEGEGEDSPREPR
jgi:hypothetical protein